MEMCARYGVKVREGKGPFVVYGHGIGGSPSNWDDLIGRIGGRATQLSFAIAGSHEADRRSFSLERHSSITGFADDLLELCAECCPRGAVYVGHSMSAMAGLLASIADPGIFSRIVLINGSARYIDDPSQGYQGGFSREAVDQTLATIGSDFSSWVGGFAPYVMANPDRPEYALEFSRTLALLGADVALAMFRAAFLGDYRREVTRVSVPCLVLQSAEDPAVPLAAARWLASAIPQGRFSALTAHGHFPHMVDPEGVYTAIEAFVLDPA